MAVFPESKNRKPQYGYDNTPLQSVKRTQPEAGNSYIRDSWGAVRFAASFEMLLSKADAYIMWAWYELNRNSDFTFFDFEWSSVAAFAVGTGNGALTIFTVPGKEIEAGGIAYVNGTPTAFTLLPLSGTNGEDRIQFAAAPANGTAITFTGSLRRRYTCEFAENATRRSMDHNRIYISMRVQQRFPLT